MLEAWSFGFHDPVASSPYFVREADSAPELPAENRRSISTRRTSNRLRARFLPSPGGIHLQRVSTGNGEVSYRAIMTAGGVTGAHELSYSDYI